MRHPQFLSWDQGGRPLPSSAWNIWFSNATGPVGLLAGACVTFRLPADPRFAFEAFYDRLRAKGYVIYPGRLTRAPSFRIGCIGHLGAAEMQGALAAIRATLAELGVASGAPAAAAA